jgi:uncharacterized protein (TIGR02300 family)
MTPPDGFSAGWIDSAAFFNTLSFNTLWRSSVTKPEWGLKRLCPSCGTRYYDMKKTPPTCPSCATAFDPEQILKVRRRAAADDKNRKTAAVVEDTPEDIEDIEAIGDEGDTAVIEDAEELGDEDSGIEEVVELDSVTADESER